ncbi:class I SAM-dependent methyltransferase [Alphaproteobacteria bacterium]|jgi:16S rRNA (guanine1516-N2)-methyltransferase|nr:class I SAM-dependent methyltransferase [Alphaproteobacteria bacterium]MDC0544273.1 class I SAM-dependent methyltransferase [Alphaproteobacteria bacterium]|tara:strand:+ start:299 stop:883 length:585 start_codon:yes stop_codon:yes gene_type:complete
MLKCSFIEGPILHRLKYGKGRGQNLAKAVGFKFNKNRTIIDATAGLGYDAFILASLGANVTLIERSEKIYDLLKAAISEAKLYGGEISKIVNRMNLLFGDSKDILPNIAPEVILIDTMYKDRKKSALVKNDMRLVREVVGSDSDHVELINVALNNASKRVVIKQPRYAETLDNIKGCSHQILGKTIRYDVYVTI